MNDDVERLLNSLTPRRAPEDLRPRVLRAMTAELASRTSQPATPRRRFPALAATFAAVVLSIGANWRTNQMDDARFTRILGPRPISRGVLALASDIAKVAGPDAVRLVIERHTATSPTITEADLTRRAVDLQRLIHELTFDPRGADHETANQEIPQVGRDRVRSSPDRRLLVERVLHLEHRPTA